MSTRIKLRGNTEAYYNTNNPLLLDREICIATDVKNFKIGPGLWNDLNYWIEGGDTSGIESTLSDHTAQLTAIALLLQSNDINLDEFQEIVDYIKNLSANQFSGDYNDLINKPTIPDPSNFISKEYVGKSEILGGLKIKAAYEDGGGSIEDTTRVFEASYMWDEENEQSVSMTPEGVVWQTKFKNYETEGPEYYITKGSLKLGGGETLDTTWYLPSLPGKLLIEEPKASALVVGAQFTIDTSSRTFFEGILTSDRSVLLQNGIGGRDVVFIAKQNNIGGHKLTWSGAIRFPKGFDSSVYQGPNDTTIFLFRFDGSVWHYIAGGILQAPISKNFADDAAAASGGVPVGGVYHNAGALRVRLT